MILKKLVEFGNQVEYDLYNEVDKSKFIKLFIHIPYGFDYTIGISFNLFCLEKPIDNICVSLKMLRKIRASFSY